MIWLGVKSRSQSAPDAEMQADAAPVEAASAAEKSWCSGTMARIAWSMVAAVGSLPLCAAVDSSQGCAHDPLEFRAKRCSRAAGDDVGGTLCGAADQLSDACDADDAAARVCGALTEYPMCRSRRRSSWTKRSSWARAGEKSRCCKRSRSSRHRSCRLSRSVGLSGQAGGKTEVDGLIRLTVENNDGANVGESPSCQADASAARPDGGAIAGQASRELPPERAGNGNDRRCCLRSRDASLRRRGTLSVRLFPDGAEVYAGDRLFGKTPFTRAAGRTLRSDVSCKPGFAPERPRSKTARPAKLGRSPGAGVTLPPPPPPSRFDIAFTPRTIAHPRPFWRWLVGGATIAGGLVLVGFGASAISVSSVVRSPRRVWAPTERVYYRDSLRLALALSYRACWFLLRVALIGDSRIQTAE